jgi:mannose-1-phosphate guanylyltransferase
MAIIPGDGSRLAQSAGMAESIRGLVLAGGSGQRLAAHTGGVPKQFFCLSHGRSLLDETIDRLAPVVAPHRLVVVVDRAHRPHVASLRGPAARGQYVYQPGDRGTAAGVLLGVSTIAEHDPDAIVVMTPADHGVRRASVFQQGLRDAIAVVADWESAVVLFGAEPDGLAGDYGWIVPDHTQGGSVRGVFAFAEKPASADVVRLFARGAVWNTMVLAGRAAALLGLVRRHQPELAEIFRLHAATPRDTRDRFLAERYSFMPSIDFSRDVLTPAASTMLLLTWPRSMGWSDLGTPERLLRWLSPEAIHHVAS